MISKDYFKREVRERFDEFVHDLDSGFAKTDKVIYTKWVFSSLSDFRNWVENAWMNGVINTGEYRHYRSLYNNMREKANIEIDKI